MGEVVRVDNTPLREAFLASGLGAATLAQRLGWYRKPTPAMLAHWPKGGERYQWPDATRVRSALGLKASTKGRWVSYRQTLPYDQAVTICHTLGLDPVDVGL